MTAAHITFPPGAIADEPLRIPLLWDSGAALALAKPAGIAALQDSRIGGGARSILADINKRAAEGAPQFERLGIRSLFAVNLLDREASGILLCARNQESRANLKNAMGSSQFSFRYRFLTVADTVQDEISCDLPVAVHRQKPLALVSHKTGKKSVTTFRCLERFRDCSLWESNSSYDRFHQVRLHAAEVGLPILGETVYTNKSPVPASAAGDLSLYRGLALHLACIRFPLGESWLELEAPFPRPLQRFLKRLAR